jgi:hypothetical protein
MPPSASGPVFTVSRPTLNGTFWAIAGVGKRLKATAPAALPAKIVRRVNLRDMVFDDMACPLLARPHHEQIKSAYRIAANISGRFWKLSAPRLDLVLF